MACIASCYLLLDTLRTGELVDKSIEGVRCCNRGIQDFVNAPLIRTHDFLIFTLLTDVGCIV